MHNKASSTFSETILSITVQESGIVLADSQCGCIINTIDCIYNKLPPDDEWLSIRNTWRIIIEIH